MTVEQFIEKRADEENVNIMGVMAYSSGLREGIELMGEFAEWVNDKCERELTGGWHNMWRLIEEWKQYTTPELIELFLTEKHKQRIRQ